MEIFVREGSSSSSKVYNEYSTVYIAERERWARPPSSFLRHVDAHPGDTLDEKTLKSFLGPDPYSNGWCRQNWALWESLKKDQRGGFPKSKLIWRSAGRSMRRPTAPWAPGRRRGHQRRGRNAAVGTPHFYEMNPEEARENRRKAYVHSDKRETFSIPGRGEHDVWHPIRFAKWTPSKKKWPDGPRGIYLLFHGGGWVFGDACGQNDVRLEEMSEELGLIVLRSSTFPRLPNTRTPRR